MKEAFRASRKLRKLQPQLEPTEPQPNRVTNSKPIPNIPLPLKEVIADVLKMKPPPRAEKTSRKAKARQ